LRVDPNERLGVLVDQEGSIGVVEYSEMPESDKAARCDDGSLLHKAGNISFFCFSMSFIEEHVKLASSLPLHKANKALPEEIATKNDLPPQKIWKFEYFIFDLLRLTKKAQVVIAPREECFAPLKNASGADSIETVQALLLQHDKGVFQKISGCDVGDKVIELSPAFYYPNIELRARWKNRAPEGGYIE
jgi:UDP-N-acetylglucosamine/UDP-N-acetylgalactosamine diphosphorylase